MTHATVFRMMSLVLFAVTGCAYGGPGMPSPSPRIISTAEIAGAEDGGVRDLYELVEHYRPNWLRVRNDPSSSIRHVVLVYRDSILLGGVDRLRDYPLRFVSSLRYLDFAEASGLPGPATRNTFLQAAIVLSTVKRPRRP